MRVIKISILLTLIAFGFSILSGCNSCNNTRKPDKIKIGYVPIAVGLPLFIANDEGYFNEQGFTTEMIKFASSNEIANAATSGQVDVSVVATNAMLDAGFVSKKRHTLIITNPYTNQAGNIADYLLVKDTNAIKKIEDLKGKKIGVFPGSVIKIFCTLIFEKHGLKKGDYTLLELSPKDWAAALQSGQIDALSALEPQAAQIILDKIGYPIVSGLYAQLMPNVPLSGHWISEDFVKKYGKEQCDKIIKAIDKAVDFINNNPAKAKEYLVKYANVREDVVGMVQLNPWKKHSELNASEVQAFIDVLFQNGAIQSKENINDYLLK
ncbi:MAG: ABC transporter substrate-binding protein [Sphingobacteriales bacterium]|nr:ABC transporter substrate-binding protein [Sphingobacteriales bacterium]